MDLRSMRARAPEAESNATRSSASSKTTSPATEAACSALRSTFSVKIAIVAKLANLLKALLSIFHPFVVHFQRCRPVLNKADMRDRLLAHGRSYPRHPPAVNMRAVNNQLTSALDQ